MNYAIVVLAILFVAYFVFYKINEGFRFGGKEYCYKFSKLTCGTVYLFLIGIGIRTLFTIPTQWSHPTDISCFVSWGNMVFQDGFGKFYLSDAMTDYPPGYMYVLWVIGAIRNLTQLSFSSPVYYFIIKLPGMMADCAIGALIYRIASRRLRNEDSLLLALFFVLNPLAILNSAVWGQVDSVYIFPLLLAIYYVAEKNLFRSLILFVVAVLIKPQAFMFSPVFLYAIYRFLKDGGFKEKFPQFLEYAVSCLSLTFALMLPFSISRQADGIKFNMFPVFEQYIGTLGSYPGVTINAYNFWGMFPGMNWYDITKPTVFGFNYIVLGAIIIVLIVLISFYYLNRTSNKSNYFFTAALINVLTFMFSMKMHERYAFAVLPLLLLAFAYKPAKKFLIPFIGFTVAFFMNYVDVLHMSLKDFDYPLIEKTMPIFSVVTMVAFILFAVVAVLAYSRREQDETAEIDRFVIYPPREKMPFSVESSERSSKITRIDALVLLVIVAAYASIAFFNLGDRAAPETFWRGEAHNGVSIDLGEVHTLGRVQYYNGAYENRHIKFEISPDNVTWEMIEDVKLDAVFRWSEFQAVTSRTVTPDATDAEPEIITNNMRGRYIRITAITGQTEILELAIRDIEDNILPVVTVTSGGDRMFDEQNLVPEASTFRNSTYFDEVYHTRTAYEYLHQYEYVLEWTHPPLGKAIQALGIMIFGMNPFGWRFMGTLFGVLMVPFIYLFSKRIFNSSFFAAFSTIAFTFDFMHFAQTRLATIDTYVTFFIIVAYYFMYSYYKTSFYDTKFWKTLVPLFFSGLAMGLAIASKWPGLYAAAGLAIIFAVVMARRYFEYIRAKKDQNLELTRQFPPKLVKTLLCCVVFFVIIPAGIYLLSYIPFYNCMKATNGLTFFETVVKNQKDMFGYHSGLTEGHPYASPWYFWVLDIRPIFYYVRTLEGYVREGISSFGNPLVWIGGLVAVFYGGWKMYKKPDKILLFLLISYFAQLVPWFAVTRATFIYHYFPAVPFLVMLLTYMFKDLFVKSKKIPIIFLAAVVGLFILFYPILSGLSVDYRFVHQFLQWLPSWNLL